MCYTVQLCKKIWGQGKVTGTCDFKGDFSVIAESGYDKKYSAALGNSVALKLRK